MNILSSYKIVPTVNVIEKKTSNKRHEKKNHLDTHKILLSPTRPLVVQNNIRFVRRVPVNLSMDTQIGNNNFASVNLICKTQIKIEKR